MNESTVKMRHQQIIYEVLKRRYPRCFVCGGNCLINYAC